MALFRAIESSRPADRRLFEDRFAPLFLRPVLRFLSAINRWAVLSQVVPWYIDSRWPGAMSAGIARTRYIDDLLLRSLAEEVDQIVILGSGFDCRAYRIPGIDRTRVFEVDEPNTLEAKRRRLQLVYSTLPPHVTFIATDFNQRQLEAAMVQGGYDSTRRTFFIWEGVTNYLTEPAVDSTLRWFATAAPGSRVVFTYVHRLVLEKPDMFIGADKVFRDLKRTGEPWTFGLAPEDVPRFLAERGLVLVDDCGANDFRSLYLDQTRRQSSGYEFYRIAQAVVAPASKP
jgi:methyltransferase (TIGR00027 family)